MKISDYFLEDGNAVYFEEAQASRFAKNVAGDFNPIHDPGSRRFCVPGDLLFTVLLSRYGVASNTTVEFSGMLDGKTRMLLPQTSDDAIDIVDSRDRALMSLRQTGVRFVNHAFIEQLCHAYVKFSGQTFPDILVPLMQSADVMINPDRPLVIYKDMTISFNDSANDLFHAGVSGQLKDLHQPIGDRLSLISSSNDIEVNGRKGGVRLSFSIEADGQQIGAGEKNMVLGGLREYDDQAMMAIVDQYNTWRREYNPT
ncbi:MAG: hypothetical protein ACI9XK_003167 [Granulosicoccus sp.]|jgi:hypothetical protein